MAPPYIRQMLTAIKGEISSNTITVGTLPLHLQTFHPKEAEYTFFSSAHGTFSRIDHILGNKSSLTKFEEIEIISSIFSYHSAMRLEINYWEKIL